MPAEQSVTESTIQEQRHKQHNKLHGDIMLQCLRLAAWCQAVASSVAGTPAVSVAAVQWNSIECASEHVLASLNFAFQNHLLILALVCSREAVQHRRKIDRPLCMFLEPHAWL